MSEVLLKFYPKEFVISFGYAITKLTSLLSRSELKENIISNSVFDTLTIVLVKSVAERPAIVIYNIS
jgi:hypothetical protein